MGLTKRSLERSLIKTTPESQEAMEADASRLSNLLFALRDLVILIGLQCESKYNNRRAKWMSRVITSMIEARYEINKDDEGK